MRRQGLGQVIARCPAWAAPLTAMLFVIVVRADVGDGPAAAGAVYVEDSPAAQELIQQADHYVRQDRLDEAAGQLQQVLRDYPNKLIPVEDAAGASGAGGGRIYTDAARYVRQRLAGRPELLKAYQAAFEAEAAWALRDAMRGFPVDGFDAAALEAVWRRYAMTPSGAEAGLTLAAIDLEQARIAAAAALLESLADHPQVRSDAELGRWHTTLADAVPRLRRAAAAMTPPTRAFADAEAVRESLATLLWEYSLASADAPGGAEPTPSSRPALAGQRLLVNDGMTVTALDRTSGQRLWSVGDAGGAPWADGDNVLVQLRNLWLDPRGVAAAGDRAFAVLGYGFNLGARFRGQLQPTRLLCIDLRPGRTLWEVRPGQLDAALDNVFFHGTPVSDGVHVYVMLRRSQMSGFQDAYVMALDAATGALRWRRHLSSTTINQRYHLLPLSQMTLSDGLLYIDDGVGAVACLDAAAGAMRWLRVRSGDVIAVPLRGGITQRLNDRNATPPIRVRAGLIVGPSANDNAAWLLDPATGAALRKLDEADSAWDQAAYLLPVGDDVLAVGRQAVRFSGDDLSLRWRTPFGGAVTPIGRGDASSGFAALPMNTGLIVLDLTNGGILGSTPIANPGSVLLDGRQIILCSGRSVRSLLAWPPALAALREQIAACPDDPGPGVALAHLALARGQADAALEGIDAALSAVRRGGVAGESVEEGEAAAAQRRVFEALIAFADPQATRDAQLRGRIIERMAALALSPQDQVAYLFVHGRWLGEIGRAADAVDCYQSVLLDPLLARQLHAEEGVSRQAWIEARRRIAALIDAGGLTVYARYAAAADQRLQQLLQSNADAEALAELAGQYPLADAAAAALLQAGMRSNEEGKPGVAVEYLRRSYQMQRNAAGAAAVVGRLVEVESRAGRLSAARRWLRQFARQHPREPAIRDGQPVTVRTWLSELAALPPGRGDLPSLQLPLGPPRMLPGSLLTPLSGWGLVKPGPVVPAALAGVVTQAGDDARTPADYLLCRDQGRVVCYRGVDLKRTWSANEGMKTALVLDAGERDVVFWSPSDNVVRVLDATTGEPVFPALSVTALLDEAGSPAQRERSRTTAERRFMGMVNPGGGAAAQLQVQVQMQLRGRVARGPRQIEEPGPPGPPAVQFGVSDAVLCIADVDGRVAAVDRRTGEPLWRLLTPMQQLTHLVMDGDVVAVGGMVEPGTDAQSGDVMVLSAATGELRIPVVSDKDPVRYLGLSPRGLLIRATEQEVTAIELGDGTITWRTRVREDEPFSGLGIVGDAAVMLGTRNEGEASWPRLFDLTTGQPLAALLPGAVTPQAAVADRAAPLPAPTVQVRAVDHRWYVLTSDAAMVLDADARLLWSDALPSDAGPRIAQQIGSDLVAVWSSPRTPAGGGLDAGGTPPLVLHLLERETGRAVDAYRFAGLSGPLSIESQLFQPNRLVLGASAQTLVFPGREAAASPPTQP